MVGLGAILTIINVWFMLSCNCSVKEEYMPVIRVTHQYELAGQVCENTYHYFHPTNLPTPLQVSQLLDDFENDILPDINAIQTDQVENIALLGYAYNLGFSQTLGLTGTGAVAAGAAGTVPPDIVLNIRRNLGDTYLNDGGALYTGNRPLRHSRFFFSGLPKAAMVASGFDPANLTAGTWAAFQTAMTAVLQTASGGALTWYHNAFGFDLPAIPPSTSFPLGKPARPDVVAPVTSVSGVDFTNLKTRD